MKTFVFFVLLSVSALFASDIKIENPYVRATPPNLPNSAVFMTLSNGSDKRLSLLKASSDVSEVVELHTHQMIDGVMKMYPVPEIAIPAQGKTTLKPGGLHIMLIGLKHALKEGEKVTLTLEFSNGESQSITAPVKTVMSGMQHHGSMNH